MKKTFLFLSAALMALVSCNKSNTPEVVVPEGRTAHVTFNVSATKATKAETVKTADEKKVSTFDAFVFNSTGDLDAYGHYTTADGAGHLTTTAGTTVNDTRLECTTGAGKRIYILINYNEAAAATLGSAITTEAQFQALTFTLLKNQNTSTPGTLDNFEMIGYATAEFRPGDNDVPVSMEAVVARVDVERGFVYPRHRPYSIGLLTADRRARSWK